MNVVQSLLAHLNLDALQFPRPERDQRDLVQRPSSPTQRGFVIFVAAFCLTMISTPAWAGTIYTWNQTGSASWATASNWTPDRTTPATDDVLVFNNGATTTATSVPVQTIGQLQVSANTLMTLQAAAAGTLTISGGAGALSVAAGSQLNVSGTAAMVINLPTGTSGSINGSITFSSTASTAHKLTAVDANGITFQNGATFTAGANMSGNAFGTANLNSIIFASGSTFIFISGANPFGASAPNSVAVFQTGSLFSHQSTALPSFSGRTYANFEMFATNFNNSSVGGSTTFFDNFTVKAGILHFNLTGNVNVKGNISVLFTNTLDFSPATPATNGLALSGSSLQTISGPGTLTFGANEIITVNNTATVKLLRDVTSLGTLTNNGVLNIGGFTLTAANIAVNAGATLTGSGTISGPLFLSGTLSPGASPGTINTANETWAGGGHYTWELNQAAVAEGTDPGQDLINVTGGLTINATSGIKFNIDITSLKIDNTAGDVSDFNSTTSYSWRILKTTTAITDFDPAAFALNTGTFSNPLGGGHFALSTANGGKDLILSFVPAPALAITCPPTTNVQCASAVPTAATDATGFIAQGGTISGNCGAVTVSANDVPTSGTCPNNFTITRTYTVTDSTCSTSKTCDQTINVNDTTNPQITCPADTVAECGKTSPAFTGAASGSDNCGGTPNFTFTDSPAPGVCPTNTIITRTWKATDACGNFATCDQTIWAVDTTPPVFTNCPANPNLGCNPNPLTIPGCDPNVGATDACSTVTIYCSSADATNGCAHYRTNTYAAVDSCHNTNTCTQVVSWTEDTTLPVVNCPADTTALCGKTGTNFTGAATATDNCTGNPVITFSDVTTAGTCPTNSIITRTWKATDACTNIATCDQTIWVLDTGGPVFTNCPTGGALGCNPATIPDCNPAVGATSDCGTTVICSKLDQTNGCSRTRTITYTAVDNCNQTNTCAQVVTWTEDTTAPVFTPQPFATCGTTNFLGCNPDETTIPHCLASVSATDSCGTPHVGCKLVQTTNLCAGSAVDGVRTRIVTYETDDACKNTNTCQQVFIWTVDTTKPTFTQCPANINLGCNPASIPDCDLSPANVAATDNCSTPTIVCALTNVTVGCVHYRTNTYTATDACGKSASCAQVITWTLDPNAPVLSGCPATTLNLGCNPASIPTTNDYNVTATDDCSTPTITRTQVTVTNGCLLTRTLTYTANDACTNSASCSQVITWTVDTVPPAFTNCPAATLNLGCNPVSIPDCDPAVGAADNCGVTNISCARVDATNGCARTRTLTYAAVDGCNNTNTCTQVISWTEDTILPVVTCPADTTALCGKTGTNFTGTATATDNCTGNPVITFSDVTTAGICPTNSIITRTWKATDACTNIATCDQTIWVLDTGGPVFTNCPTGGALGCNPASIPDCNPAVGATSDCGTTVICSKLDQTNGCSRTRTITYTAVDNCNQTNTCAQVVTWTEDTTAPVFTPQPFATCSTTNFLGCNPDETTIPHCLASVSATDSCGTPHVGCKLVQTTNFCAGSAVDGVRTRIVTYEADDACKNTNTCAQVFIWTVDHTAPTFTKCPASTNLGCNLLTIPDCDLDPTNVTASDNCSVPVITCNRTDATNGCGRTRTIIYTATDACGNTKTCTQTITWREDTVGPVLSNCPAPTLDLGTNPPPANVPTCATYNVTATDACGASTLTCTSVTVTNGCGRTRTLTYTAVDICNNTNTCSQVITWTIADSPPILTIVVQGTNVVIGWPLTCVNFVLQQTPSLNPATWTSAGLPAPVVVGGMNTVTVPIGNIAFYRLNFSGP